MGDGTGRTRPRDVARVAEALLALAAGSAVRRSLPTRRWHALLGEPVRAPLARPDDSPPTGVEADVQVAMARAARRLPWRADCLDQAIAAQIMLRARARPGIVIIGLRREGEWNTHAWLLGQTGTVVGGPASAGYTAVSAFEPKRHRAA